MKDILHFDVVNVMTTICIAIAAWVGMRNTITWHTAWIQKHSAECDEQRRMNNRLLTELQTTNAHLITLAETYGERLERLEKQIDDATRRRQ